jgi:hypothetical protein
MSSEQRKKRVKTVDEHCTENGIHRARAKDLGKRKNWPDTQEKHSTQSACPLPPLISQERTADPYSTPQQPYTFWNHEMEGLTEAKQAMHKAMDKWAQALRSSASAMAVVFIYATTLTVSSDGGEEEREQMEVNFQISLEQYQVLLNEEESCLDGMKRAVELVRSIQDGMAVAAPDM